MKNINKIYYKEIKELLEINNVKIISDIKNNEYFLSLNSIENSNDKELTFLNNETLTKSLSLTKAKACLITEKNINFLPKNTFPIIVDDPFYAFAIISKLFKKEKLSNGLISKMTAIDTDVDIKNNVQIDSFVTINHNCIIHPNVIIESGSTIGPNVVIFENTTIKSNSVIKDSIIGANCIIKSGAVIGGTGFGFHPISKHKFHHFGNVIIKDNCNIGSNTTIDKAVFESTVISENCFIDNLVHIAHNVFIDSDCIIAAQTGIAGSTKIGKNVTIGGQAGISGHLNIGNHVTIAAKSGVTKNIKDNSIIAGFPAIDIKQWKLINIKLKKNL